MATGWAFIKPNQTTPEAPPPIGSPNSREENGMEKSSAFGSAKKFTGPVARVVKGCSRRYEKLGFSPNSRRFWFSGVGMCPQQHSTAPSMPLVRQSLPDAYTSALNSPKK
jgi:hypothetical protein